MDGFRVRIRVEIVPEGDADGEVGDIVLDGVDEEVVERITAAQALSIDDMEETLLGNAYDVLRQALSKHFAERSKRGLSNGSPRAR